jgi:hypothetical protein
MTVVRPKVNLCSTRRRPIKDVTVYLPMPKISHTHVRPLEIGDFNFVRGLASKQPDFTVPPAYVLWLIMRIKGAVGLVAEDNDRGRVAYLLAVPSNGPKESLFVWQLAAVSGSGQEKASLALLTALRDFASRKHVQSISFSTRPGSAAYRLIARYTNILAARTPSLTSPLPSTIASDESEFRVDLE